VTLSSSREQQWRAVRAAAVLLLLAGMLLALHLMLMLSHALATRTAVSSSRHVC
jgi:hypothetical protein